MSRTLTCMVVITMLLTMGIALAQEGLEGQCWYDRICMNGYFRIRYMDVNSDSGFDNFDLRDLYLTFQGDIDDRTRGIITFARVGPNDPDITIYNLFADYSLGEQWKIQMGQTPTWFGLEAWEGSSVRLPFERAKILEGTAQNGLGFFWQGASDRGVWLRRMPTAGSEWEPMFIAGVYNGQFRADDANDDKNFDIHLKWMKDWGQFGTSWMTGDFVTGGVETDRSAWDVYVRVVPNTVIGPVGFRAEYADGELLGADRDGWYAQASYAVPDRRDVGYLRYEEFNAEQDAANSAEFTGWTVGYMHPVQESSELTVEYRNGEWDRMGTIDGISGDNSEDWLGVEWQYSFR